MNGSRILPRSALAAWMVPALLLAAGCEKKEPPPAEVSDKPLLVLGKSYPAQRLPAGGEVGYRFRTTARGAYLIIVSDVAAPADVTLKHPKKTCFLAGNGSCELVSSPDEAYDFQISQKGGEAFSFTLLVTHVTGTASFEGVTTAPLPIRIGRPHQGRVGMQNSSYYRFVTGSRPDYTISATGAHSDLSWVLFDRWFFDIILHVCDAHPGAQDETCTLSRLDPHTLYYMKVTEASGVPGTFELLVQAR